MRQMRRAKGKSLIRLSKPINACIPSPFLCTPPSLFTLKCFSAARISGMSMKVYIYTIYSMALYAESRIHFNYNLWQRVGWKNLLLHVSLRGHLHERFQREKLLFAICALSNGRRGERERKGRGRTGLRVKWVRQRLKKEGWPGLNSRNESENVSQFVTERK